MKNPFKRKQWKHLRQEPTQTTERVEPPKKPKPQALRPNPVKPGHP